MTDSFDREAGKLSVARQSTLVPRSALPSGGTIVLLNGTSSSGKTSLAKALQTMLPQQYLHVQLNAFRDMEPAGYFSRGHAASSALRVAALCRAMHASVAQFAAHGQNVVFDHVLSADAWHYLFEDFQEQQLYLVGVHCSVEELVRRERTRGDREHGLAESQACRIHQDREYDFCVDTTGSNPSACANALVHWLEQDPVPCAFARMRALHGYIEHADGEALKKSPKGGVQLYP
jgi:chloramphenicol 3-O phosphotransferase